MRLSIICKLQECLMSRMSVWVLVPFLENRVIGRRGSFAHFRIQVALNTRAR